jgi:hypothetical protein
MNRRTLLLGLLVLPLLGISPRRAYLKEHRAWTRELTLYNDFSTALVMRATLLEPAFRDVIASERHRLVNPSAENHAAFVARMAEDGRLYHEVVYAADSAFENAEKFGPGDDRWNVRLVADGVEETLVAIDRVRNPSALHDALYVQTDIWSQLWIARFTRTVQSPAEVRMIVGGGYGNGELRWELR